MTIQVDLRPKEIQKPLSEWIPLIWGGGFMGLGVCLPFLGLVIGIRHFGDMLLLAGFLLIPGIFFYRFGNGLYNFEKNAFYGFIALGLLIFYVSDVLEARTFLLAKILCLAFYLPPIYCFFKHWDRFH